jgi:hypothetical protein
MNFRLQFRRSHNQRIFDARLAAYLASAGALGTAVASESQAAVVGNTTVQPFGVNGFVSIDFNMDGQIDFQIDHDRVDLTNMGGGVLDYLQIDKNDINGETNPLVFDPIAGNQAATFPPNMTTPNDANDSAYVINPNVQGSYPAALTFGTPIGPTSSFDWQESNNFQGGGKWIRANRLMDEDATQIDQILGGRPASGVQVPFNGPNFDGLGGEVRYLGLKMDLNSTNQINYGWVGVRITNEADATGQVVGWAYQTIPSVPILAGAIPEPSTILTAVAGGAMMVGCFLGRRWRRG